MTPAIQLMFRQSMEAMVHAAGRVGGYKAVGLDDCSEAELAAAVLGVMQIAHKKKYDLPSAILAIHSAHKRKGRRTEK